MWSIIVAVIAAGSTFYFLEMYKMPRVHTLEFPLLLDGSGAPGRNYLLPTGTTLCYEREFPEGFTSFRTYINVEGVNLKLTKLSDPTRIMPIGAYPIGKLELVKLLREYPLSKSDLAAILKSGQLSKEEIREVLMEFSK